MPRDIEKKRAHDRAYRANHIEELLARERAYREAHREQRLAYKQAHLEEHIAYNKAYREAHREQARAYHRQFVCVLGEKVSIRSLPPELQEVARLLKANRKELAQRGGNND